jgi:NitT/TauT family transport system substrate-binding protein
MTPLRSRIFHNTRRGAMLATLAAALLSVSTFAAAEGKVRIVDQFGLTSLLWHVARAEGYIQKQGKAQGIDIEVEWSRLSGGSAVNDALLSGAADIAHIGVGPTLLLWDRTAGKQNFKAFAAVGTTPQYLVSNRPDAKTIRDLKDSDRIAVVSTASQQARTLQLAAAQTFGIEQFSRFDKLLVTLPHTEAMALLETGKGGITSHFSNAPFQYQQIKRPGTHVILNSYDVMGGPSSSALAVTSEKFRRDNPKTYNAIKLALADASRFVAAHKQRAAEIYIEAEKSSTPVADVLAFLNDPEISYEVLPRNTERLGKFLYQVKVLKNEPRSWKDYFFDDVHGVAGS